MLIQTERPLTNEERESLRPKSNAKSNALTAGVFAQSVIYFAYTLLCHPFPQLKWIDKSLWGAAMGLFPLVLVGLYVYRKEQLKLNQSPDLVQGVAEIIHVEATRAIKVEELEDEGVGFYLDVGGSNVLFLCGQYLYEEEEEKRFPCDRFTLIRARYSKRVLEMVTEGIYLPPIHTNPPFTKQDYKKGRVHWDGEILNVDFDTLKKDFPQQT